MAKIFLCACCSETFETTWTDAEAWAEADRLHGEIPPEEVVVVCDRCHRMMAAFYGLPLDD
jgi:hypothetical protein